MRTVEEIDKDIAQAERSFGFYVQYARSNESMVQSMLSELQRAGEEQKRIEALREEKRLASKEDSRKGDLFIGYLFMGLGVIFFCIGLAILNWSTLPDRWVGGCLFLGLGIIGACGGFGGAQRAHARKTFPG